MNDKYNFYDTPDNHPEVKKYRSLEAVVLIFGIGVVSTLLILSYMFGKTPQKQAPPTPTQAIQAPLVTATPAFIIVTPAVKVTSVDACEMMYGARLDRPLDTERLQQLLMFAQVPITEAYVTAFANICVIDLEKDIQTVQSATSDITVVVGETAAANEHDFAALGDIIADILPAILKTEPEDPQTVTIRFMSRQGYHQWRQDYSALTRQFTVTMRGLSLWELQTLSEQN